MISRLEWNTQGNEAAPSWHSQRLDEIDAGSVRSARVPSRVSLRQNAEGVTRLCD